MKIKHLKNILVIGLIASAIYFLPSYIGILQQTIGVKGTATERTKEISSQIGSDINSQVGVVKKQILDVTISDIIASVSKLSKVSQDIKNGQKVLKEQLDNMIKSKK